MEKGEIAFMELDQKDGTPGNNSQQSSSSLFNMELSLERKIGLIASFTVILLCCITILVLVCKIRRKDRQRNDGNRRGRRANSSSSSGGGGGGRGMFERNIEMVSGVPYTNLSNSDEEAMS